MIYACHAIILEKVLKINQQNKGACTVNQKKKIFYSEESIYD